VRSSLLLLPFLGFATPALASDGLLEINQTCAVQTGCFAGDAPGYPITIVESGSYRLTGNLLAVGIAGATLSIEILAPARDVTLDLNGFTLDGGGSCSASVPTGATCFISGGPNGIGSTTNAQVSIRNGSLRGLRGGISILSAASVTIEDVQVTEGSNSGISVTSGIPTVVRHATVSITTGRGIDVGSAGTVIDSIADHNSNSGIRAAEITRSRASANTSSGIDASFAGARVSESRAFGNGLNGISTGVGAIVTASSVHQNPVGIQLASGGSVVSSTIRDNAGFGISAAADATYGGCTLTGNNGGANNAQVAGGVQIGPNFCGTDTVCP
jgi:hypothetical protein